ncbi:LLM class flavin-dependent oxidoreductase [Amycolatopsis ultiminotia]|uniref:LLM class flavin-dependent oxidoreductase n=1 Tax=Amycolatopsis ultiminotia TaxID=543629 RepID=A0ABP6X9N3_9PSEU
MKIGIGLPIGDVGTVLALARHADAGPFTTLGLLDRLVYDNPEPLVTLAAVAGATSRVRVQTEVLLVPLRDPVLLAKQAATLDRISHGRFTLGIGVGTRADDYRAAGVEFANRGRRLDEQLACLRDIWAGAPGADPIGPAPARAGGPEILFGGFKTAALHRVARWGDGFLCAAPLEWAGPLMRAVERSWHEAGRSGRPRLVAQVNVALGPDRMVTEAKHAIRSYYGEGEYADQAAERTLTSPRQIRDVITAFGDLGVDELMLYCWSPEPEQVHRLADAVA